MYITKNLAAQGGDHFDWETYFSQEQSGQLPPQVEPRQVLHQVRGHLKEDKSRMTLTLTKLMRNVLTGLTLENPRILELGAATGFLTRWLISQYGGSGVLVDSSPASYQAYRSTKSPLSDSITYLREDIFQLEPAESFDLVCSFGLIEHFKDKQAVLEAHWKFARPHGLIVILVPSDTRLTRVFFEAHMELNTGYRELLTMRELENCVRKENLEIVNSGISNGYAYDFGAVVCRPPQEIKP
ncbi:MAG: methyltransferase domain-containing protein [bacterium]|nr:methyltransferase domain-containing protein [bacterium]